MRSILKKVSAAILAAALCLSFAGCYNENDTWAAKKGDSTLPIGSYIYFLDQALAEARGKVSSDQEVLKATIDGKGAEEWIRNRAMEYLKAYFYVEDKFDELGLELHDHDLSDMESNTEAFWTNYGYGSVLEPMGIARESFHLAFTVYNTKHQEVMDAMYAKGGELDIPESELKEYFAENYYYYDYFYAPLSSTDSEGQSTALTDEEKADLKKKLEDYAKKVNSGSLSLENAAKEYAGSESSTFISGSTPRIENLSTDMKTAIENAKDNEAVFAETSSAYYVVLRRPIYDGFTAVNDSETQRSSMIYYMKSEEFNDFVLEQGGKVEGLEINQHAIDKVKLSKLVTDDIKNGTSSASSEAE